MTGWIVRRLVAALVTFLLATTLVFFLMRLTPGDPLARLSEDRPLPPATIASLRARFGLDQPLLIQYTRFLRGVLQGDLGASIEQNGRPVTGLIRERLPATLLLGGTALGLNFLVGMLLGVWQAERRGSTGDRVASVLSLAAYATPSFWLGLVLAWAFGTELRWFPVGFMHSVWLVPEASALARVRDVAWHLCLPAITLATVTFGATARYQRAAMIDVLGQDWIRSARTRGLPDGRIRWRHAWRNALGPVLALFGLWLPLLVAGSVFVESVFSWPGLGRLAADAIASRDYPVIMGATILVSAAIIGGNLLADLLHRWVDPRLRTA